MNITFSAYSQIPKIVNKISKFSTNPIYFKGADEHESLELQYLTPEAEAQYQEQKKETDWEIENIQKQKAEYEAEKSDNEKPLAFYKEIMNPDKPYYQQLSDLIQTLKAANEEEKQDQQQI